MADTIVAYRKQLEIKPDHELAWNGLSITLARQGQLADAIAAYLKHLQIKTRP